MVLLNFNNDGFLTMEIPDSGWIQQHQQQQCHVHNDDRLELQFNNNNNNRFFRYRHLLCSCILSPWKQQLFRAKRESLPRLSGKI